MPYVIVSTVALFANLYRNAPLIVGDKDSDPDLMRYLGARLSTSYPVCGSQPMYVMHAPPRSVFDNLEKRGYCLMAAQTIQEHAVWVLARPRVPEDDKTEIQRGGPNDKSIQATADEIDAQNPGKSSKETETDAKKAKGTTDTDKKEKSDTSAKDSEKTVKTYPLSKVHRFTQSNVDLSASKGDHVQLKSILKRDDSNMGRKYEKSELFFSSPSKSILSAVQSSELSVTKSETNISLGKEKPTTQNLLDGCTQTGYGDILRPPYIPNLPKVITSEPTPPWKKNSFTSLTNLISQFQEEPSITKPCGVAVSRLLEQNPIFADIPDRTHLGCLTQCEGCCCEE